VPDKESQPIPTAQAEIRQLIQSIHNVCGRTLTHFFLTTGVAFFTRFPQFQGKVLNAKLQIPLPADFFVT
jgi:hypothetical protein